jgi:Glycosyl transferase family 2
MDHSFVVLAYRDSPFLAGCLKGLAEQSLASRILVSTSTPSPFIARAAAEAGAELRVNPQADGIAPDWNFGLAQAQTRYATLAHQDDTYAPDFTAKSLALFAREPAGSLCFTGYQEIDDEGAPKSSKISRAKHLIELATIGRREVLQGRRLLTFLSFGNPLPCSSVTFDKVKLPDFQFSADYRSNLDWEAWWRLAQAGETFLHVPGRLVGRRHNALTATSSLITEGTRRVEDARMFRKAWPRPVADAIAWAYRAGY